jgi:hypothetical protein
LFLNIKERKREKKLRKNQNFPSQKMMFKTFFRGLLACLVSSSVVTAASLQQVSNWGSNPSNIQMYIYVPNNVASNPAIIVAVSFINSGLY